MPGVPWSNAQAYPSNKGFLMEFDTIIAGAGAAGCVLANRLSADPGHSVLLLEAGEKPESIWFKLPVGYRYTIGNPRWDWCYTGAPEPALHGRVLKHPRGKVLGGSTSINGMEVVRGQARDYDDWRDAGLTGWGWDDVLPYFKKSEDFHGGNNAFHQQGGEWRVDTSRVFWPLQDAVQAACVQAGIPALDDFNTGDHHGVGLMQVNQKNGRRWSAADGFLKPVLHRPNLHLQTGALIDKVLLDGKRATGLVWRQGGTAVSAKARKEVILCAGSLGTPPILMRSGIGPAPQMAFHGIQTVAHLPGVGANLHDHLQIGMRYEVQNTDTLNRHMHSKLAKAWMAARFALTARGPLTMAPCQLGMFARTGVDGARADIGYNLLPFSRDNFQQDFDPFPGLTMVFYDLRPTSRGQLRLLGRDPATAPEITMNYLASERDQRVAAEGIRTTRRIMGQSALERLAPAERWAGSGVQNDNEAALVDVARRVGVSIFHPVGTARMGLRNDPMAVVDARLRVLGVDRLRVVDASVMPAIISGNTATPTIMIAEKGAAMILEDR